MDKKALLNINLAQKKLFICSVNTVASHHFIVHDLIKMDGV